MGNQRRAQDLIFFIGLIVIIITTFWMFDFYRNKDNKRMDLQKIDTPYVKVIESCGPLPTEHGPFTPFGDKNLICSVCYRLGPARYGFTQEDILLLSQLLCGEENVDGDGEYDFGFQTEINDAEVKKVLEVVMNRVRSDAFPDTVNEVIMADGQFVVMPKNSYSIPSQKVIDYVTAWCRLYDHYFDIQTIPDDHLFFGADGHGGNKTNTRAWR